MRCLQIYYSHFLTKDSDKTDSIRAIWQQDTFSKKYESGYNEFAYQTVASVASGNGWDFKSFIRRVNIMLSHIDNSSMTEAQKDHWRAVG